MKKILLFLILLTMPGYAKNSVIEVAELSKIPDYAGDFETKGWGFRAKIVPEQGGLKQLDMPLFVLVHVDSSFKDLRLVQGGRQVPYLLEHFRNVSAVTPQMLLDSQKSDAHRSVWMLSLPFPKLPLHTLSCEISDVLFDREVFLFEWRVNALGEKKRYDLGRTYWKRLIGAANEPFLLPLRSSPETSSLVLEIQNGDNVPLSFSKLEFQYQTVRLIFKAPAESPLWLYYGNPQAFTPSYDAITTLQEFASWKSEPVFLENAEVLKSRFWLNFTPSSLFGKIIFWLVLSGVVVAILIVISKLLPEKK